MSQSLYSLFLKSSELFSADSSKDETYTFNRNCAERLDILQHCELMWKDFKPFCGDPNFVKDFQNRFRQKWWELFLAQSFMKNGFHLQSSKSKGPDINLKMNSGSIRVEAISMTDGEEGKPDTVPSIKYGIVQTVPTEKILLRLTAGFKEKAVKFKSYLSEDIVDDCDKLIIAIDMSGVSHADMADKEEVPLACKALLGIGELTMSIPVDRNKGKPKTFYPPREKISKSLGAPVPATGMFLENFSHISAIITNVRSFTEVGRNPKCLRMILNPLAKNKLSISDFYFMKDIFYEQPVNPLITNNLS